MNDLPLHDIHLPAAVSGWPPAIGWWLLPVIICVLALIIFKLVQLKKRYKAPPAYKKIARNEMQRLEENFKANGNTLESLKAISALLRRIALSYLPRESVASLTGEQWIEQLNALCGETVFNAQLSDLLINAPYQQTLTEAHNESQYSELFEACKQWINLLPAHATTSAITSATTSPTTTATTSASKEAIN
ncbi:hypothetical protein MNBD_GAMMA10-1988 [hydrothermal vent metagenome]|uniref:DUF4381 domain-containing protein n=1 Tax=hydrothermal vent metagenome TaxID=652676 RepID=A0A3B0XID5_9ZZZZ